MGKNRELPTIVDDHLLVMPRRSISLLGLKVVLERLSVFSVVYSV